MAHRSLLLLPSSELGSEVCNLRIANNVNLNRDQVGVEHDASGSGRRNKRKNFLPRNIVEYAGSDEEEDHGQKRTEIEHVVSPPDSCSMASPPGENTDGDEEDGDGPLDLSEVQNRK